MASKSVQGQEKDREKDRAKDRASVLVAVLGGLALGGGGTSAWFLLKERPRQLEPVVQERPQVIFKYVNVPRLTVPMADENGNLLGYVTLDLALEVQAGDEEYVKQRIPMIRHGLNALLYGGANYGKPAQPEQLDIKRATPDMLKAANGALDRPVIRSLSVITALPG